MKAENMFSILN